MYEHVVLVGLILQVLTLVTLSFFLFQLSTQQGRILLRLDSLEGKRPDFGRGASGPKGLAAGTAMEDFAHPDLTGKTRSLSEFPGLPLQLIYRCQDWSCCDVPAL